jgi:hypothetical protein
MHTVGAHVGADGIGWLLACFALGALWIALAAWRGGDRRLSTAMRGALGGLAAFWAASIGYGLLDLCGVSVQWEWLTRGTWSAVGLAALIGLVEEGAKLVGIGLAAAAGEQGRRHVIGMTMAVAAVFGVAEAAFAVRGASWPVAFARLAFAPIAHGILAAPVAFAMAGAAHLPRLRLLGRLALGVGLASLIHGLGDWSILQAGWGRLGFALSLLAPTLWLYAHLRATSPHVPAQIGGRAFAP